MDLRDTGLFPPVFVDARIPCCQSSALAACLYYAEKRAGRTPAVPSRLFSYYNARLLEGTQGSVVQAHMMSAIRGLQQSGWCDESLWPWVPAKATTRPPSAAYVQAASRLVSAERFTYLGKTSASQILTWMTSTILDGWPFAFALRLYRNFGKTPPIVPMPSGGVSGLHAMVCVGLDPTRRLFICRDSRYGEFQGDKGHWHLPYDYLASDDCWDRWKIGAGP